MGIEIWKDIEGYEGYYQVSNFGRVKSLPKKGSGSSMVEIIMRDFDNTKGYRYTTLSKCKIRRNWYIHILVARAFIANPLSLPQVNHKDGVKQNNNASNLEWCDLIHNMQHASKMQLLASGEQSPFSKLSAKEVREIRRLHKQGIQRKSLARAYCVSKAQIHRIVHNQLWKSEA